MYVKELPLYPGEEPAKRYELVFSRVEDANNGAHAERKDQRVRLAHRVAAVAVEALQSRGGRDARRECEPLLVDQLTLHRYSEEHAHCTRRERKGSDDQPGEVSVRWIEDQQRTETGRNGSARRIASRRGCGLHAVVLENRHRRQPAAGKHAQSVPKNVRKNARCNCDPERPAQFQCRVEIRRRHQHAEYCAGSNGAKRELRHPVALIHVGVPVKILLVGRSLLPQRLGHVFISRVKEADLISNWNPGLPSNSGRYRLGRREGPPNDRYRAVISMRRLSAGGRLLPFAESYSGSARASRVSLFGATERQ